MSYCLPSVSSFSQLALFPSFTLTSSHWDSSCYDMSFLSASQAQVQTRPCPYMESSLRLGRQPLGALPCPSMASNRRPELQPLAVPPCPYMASSPKLEHPHREVRLCPFTAFSPRPELRLRGGPLRPYMECSPDRRQVLRGLLCQYLEVGHCFIFFPWGEREGGGSMKTGERWEDF